MDRTPEVGAPAPNPAPSEGESPRDRYWRQNLRYLVLLLSLWFLVSFGCGVLWVDQLDQIRIGGFKLGFWFAQQGSIVGFVLLIVAYVKLMNRLDKQFDVEDREEDHR